MTKRVYVDANPTHICYVVKDGSKNNQQPVIMELPERCTNNEAEYKAVIAALLMESGIDEILSDSQLVVNQLNLDWAIKEERLRILAKYVWQIGIGVKFTWIPRKQNKAGKVLG